MPHPGACRACPCHGGEQPCHCAHVDELVLQVQALQCEIRRLAGASGATTTRCTSPSIVQPSSCPAVGHPIQAIVGETYRQTTGTHMPTTGAPTDARPPLMQDGRFLPPSPGQGINISQPQPQCNTQPQQQPQQQPFNASWSGQGSWNQYSQPSWSQQQPAQWRPSQQATEPIPSLPLALGALGA